MTPSGLSIGTILNTKCFLSISASGDRMYCISPSSIWEAYGSPGWTLLEMKIVFFLECSFTYVESLCPNPVNFGLASMRCDSLNSMNCFSSSSRAARRSL